MHTDEKHHKQYVTAQQHEFEMFMYANGPYDLADTRVYLRKERHVWMLRSVKLHFLKK